jgi:hypothetical protein
MSSNHILIYSYNRILIYSYTHKLLYSYTHILIYSYTHILIYSYTHILIYSYTHILIHIDHTHTLAPVSAVGSKVSLPSFSYQLISSGPSAQLTTSRSPSKSISIANTERNPRRETIMGSSNFWAVYTPGASTAPTTLRVAAQMRRIRQRILIYRY